MKTALQCNGKLVTIKGHHMHVYTQGNKNHPKLVLMSGSGTIAPVYDFKVLYEKLAAHFRIIVIEKFGYGYSDIYESSCDIDSLVGMQRQALTTIGETGPYLLAPHSMSGLEAIRWKQTYPEEVAAIIGLDMAGNAQHLPELDGTRAGKKNADHKMGREIQICKLSLQIKPPFPNERRNCAAQAFEKTKCV